MIIQYKSVPFDPKIECCFGIKIDNWVYWNEKRTSGYYKLNCTIIRETIL